MAKTSYRIGFVLLLLITLGVATPFAWRSYRESVWLENLKSADPTVMSSAADGLAKMRSRRAIPLLVELSQQRSGALSGSVDLVEPGEDTRHEILTSALDVLLDVRDVGLLLDLSSPNSFSLRDWAGRKLAKLCPQVRNVELARRLAREVLKRGEKQEWFERALLGLGEAAIDVLKEDEAARLPEALRLLGQHGLLQIGPGLAELRELVAEGWTTGHVAASCIDGDFKFLDELTRRLDSRPDSSDTEVAAAIRAGLTSYDLSATREALRRLLLSNVRDISVLLPLFLEMHRAPLEDKELIAMVLGEAEGQLLNYASALHLFRHLVRYGGNAEFLTPHLLEHCNAPDGGTRLLATAVIHRIGATDRAIPELLTRLKSETAYHWRYRLVDSLSFLSRDNPQVARVCRSALRDLYATREESMTVLFGPTWRLRIEQRLSGVGFTHGEKSFDALVKALSDLKGVRAWLGFESLNSRDWKPAEFEVLLGVGSTASEFVCLRILDRVKSGRRISDRLAETIDARVRGSGFASPSELGAWIAVDPGRVMKMSELLAVVRPPTVRLSGKPNQLRSHAPRLGTTASRKMGPVSALVREVWLEDIENSSGREQLVWTTILLLGPEAHFVLPDLVGFVRDRFKSRFAVEALVEIGARSVRPLLDLLDTETDRITRHWVVYALGRLGSHSTLAIPVLEGLLSAEDTLLKENSALALGRIARYLPAAKQALERHAGSPIVARVLRCLGSVEPQVAEAIERWRRARLFSQAGLPGTIRNMQFPHDDLDLMNDGPLHR